MNGLTTGKMGRKLNFSTFMPRRQGLRIKDLGRFIIQTCPTYNDERCSRRMIIKINIYCQYIMLTI